jgi:hypothetical protein
MAEQSQRDEMNAAIRAQRERQAVPRSIAGAGGPDMEGRRSSMSTPPDASDLGSSAPEDPAAAPPEQEPEVAAEPLASTPEQPARKGLLSRLFGR